MKQNLWKQWLVAMLVLVLVMGCSNGGSTQGSADETSGGNSADDSTGVELGSNDTDDSEKKTVTIWDYFETDAQKAMMTELLDDFNASQDEYVAEHVYVPFANFKNQLTMGLQTDDLPDLVIIDNPDMASYIALGLFADITDQISDIDLSAYIEGPLQSTMYEGRNYGLPFATNCTALFYNKAIFDEAGVEYPYAGMTWDEFAEKAEQVTDVQAGIAGFGLSAVNSEEGVFQCLPWLYSAGASYDSINNEAGLETITFMRDMVQKGAIAKESLNWTQSDVNNQFMSGTIAMQQNGPWQLPGIASNAPELDYGITLMPTNEQSVSALGGENLGVVNSDNVEGAVAFLKYYNQDEVMIEAMKNYGSFPTKTEAANDSFWTDDERQKVFIEQLATSVPRGPSPVWPQVSTVIANTFQRGMATEDDIAEVLETNQAEIDGILN